MAAADYTSAGAFNIDGQWATAIRFEATLAEDSSRHVASLQLRFMNGRNELAAAVLSASDAQRVLGSVNYETILKATGTAGGSGIVRGELRGKYLAFRRATLTPTSASIGNAVEPDERLQGITAPAGQGASGEPLATENSSHSMAGPPAPPAIQSAVPPWVKQRFLSVGNRYYFPDRTLAFTDDGLKLKAETHNTEVVRGLLAIAESRGWTSLQVSGSTTFRREIWRQAQTLGIAVRGYEPTDADRGATQPSSVGASRPAVAQTAVAEGPVKTSGTASRAAINQLITGTLTEAGAAPYRFDQTKGLSYYLKLHTATGERILWGTDLERALVESASSVKIGDTVTIEYQGSTPVTVKAIPRDGAGNVADMRVEAQRHRWLVEKPEYFDARAARAAAFRSGQTWAPTSATPHPGLAAATVNLWLSEQLVERYVERADDRSRVVTAARQRLADALARDDAISTPVLNAKGQQRLAAFRGVGEFAGPRARGRSVRIQQREAEERTPEGP